MLTMEKEKTERTSSSSAEQEKLSLWPEPLAENAYEGLAGEIIKIIEPHSEADPAALLFSLFVLYGNVIGRTAYFVAEADRHFLNLFLAGESSK